MKHSKGVQILLLLVFLAGFMIDIFYFPITLDWGSDSRLLLLVILWLFFVKLSHFNSRATFKVALIFLMLLSLLFIFSRDFPPIERIASWIYIFLAIGILQQLFENPKKKQKTHIN